MLLPATASNITSMLTTSSYVLPCTPTTHPTDWAFSPSVPLTLGSGTCRTDSSSIQTVSIAGVDLPVTDEMKVLGVVLDRRLTFVKHVMAVARSCNYHAQAIRHIPHLLSTDLATTLACSPAPGSTTAIRYYMELRLAVSRHYSVSACAEQCSPDRPAGTEAIACTAVTASTAMAASSSQN